MPDQHGCAQNFSGEPMQITFTTLELRSSSCSCSESAAAVLACMGGSGI